MRFVSSDCSKKLFQIFVFAHSVFSCQNNCFCFLMGLCSVRRQIAAGKRDAEYANLFSCTWVTQDCVNFILSRPSHKHNHYFGMRWHTGLFCFQQVCSKGMCEVIIAVCNLCTCKADRLQKLASTFFRVHLDSESGFLPTSSEAQSHSRSRLGASRQAFGTYEAFL